MEYPLWPSKRSLDRLQESILEYARNPGVNNLPILQGLSESYRQKLAWVAQWRTVPIVIIEGTPEETTHESQITFQTNTLREIIPNFNVGLLRAICDGKKWITPPCPGRDGETMFITEYTPGIPLRQYIDSRPDFFSMLSLFIQILRALEIARSKLGAFSGVYVSSIIVRPLDNSMLIDYDGMAIEDLQYPVIVNFENSSLTDNNVKEDIYELLISMFSQYPEISPILQFYGVQYYPGYPDEWWIENMSPMLILRPVNELVAFAWQVFGYQPVRVAGLPQLLPQDIPGYGPRLVEPEVIQTLASEGRARASQRFTRKR